MVKKLIISLSFMSFIAFSGEGDLYDFRWLSPDKEVFVLQNKIFEKEGSFYFNFGYGDNSNTDYQETTLFGVYTGYFFKEEWGVELFYNSYSNKDSDTFKNASFDNTSLPFIRRFNSMLGGLLLYSPFYAKMNTFNKIFYIELMFGLGLSQITAETNQDDFRVANTLNRYESESFTGLTMKAQARVYASERININIDYIRTYYQASTGNSDNEELRKANDIVISVGFNI